ncbi:MAG TPA: hypothetical protein VFU21_03810, partial [Kofleriaceae bacterium]|nr:hypothetical protein [Kofleriaceae bacterium]
AGLKRLGVTASDARQAVASSRRTGTIEERMRGALAALHTIYAARRGATRCSEPRRVRWIRAGASPGVACGHDAAGPGITSADPEVSATRRKLRQMSMDTWPGWAATRARRGAA